MNKSSSQIVLADILANFRRRLKTQVAIDKFYSTEITIKLTVEELSLLVEGDYSDVEGVIETFAQQAISALRRIGGS